MSLSCIWFTYIRISYNKIYESESQPKRGLLSEVTTRTSIFVATFLFVCLTQRLHPRWWSSQARVSELGIRRFSRLASRPCRAAFAVAGQRTTYYRRRRRVFQRCTRHNPWVMRWVGAEGLAVYNIIVPRKRSKRWGLVRFLRARGRRLRRRR